MNDPVSPGAALAASTTASVAAVVGAVDLTMFMFGVPLPVVLAAFGGACMALAILPAMRMYHIIMAVMMGTGFGVYGSQLIISWQNMNPKLTGPTAFFLGLFAHVLMTTAFKEGRELILLAMQNWLRAKLTAVDNKAKEKE